MKRKKNDPPAGIEYAGIAGASKDCHDAVMRLLQYGDRITQARILSSSRTHCLLLSTNTGDLVAVKSGFASGYGGEGPRRFSYTLQLLKAHGAEIEEYNVDGDLIRRLDDSALTVQDIELLEAARPSRPSRWHDYVDDRHFDDMRSGRLWQEFPSIIPFGIVDERIVDLAVSFWENPDDGLMTGYRRLEEIVRARTVLKHHGQKLISQTFFESPPKLTWNDAKR